VAHRWRIRHKLMLGLGLVVGIMALMLTGTLKGLMSYRATMKSIDSKLTELKAAGELKGAVNDLEHAVQPQAHITRKDAPGQSSTGDFVPPRDTDDSRVDEKTHFERKMTDAQAALERYREQLEDTLSHGRDPNRGYSELTLIDLLKESFHRLDKAKTEHYEGVSHNTPTTPLADDPAVKAAVLELRMKSDELQRAIYQDLYDRIDVSKRDYRTSMIIVIATSVIGTLLTAGLLRFFYGWVFYPIRDLEEGAGRVALGDFEHKIEVHSGDEMEDLAAAFNDMTSRLREIYNDLARQVNERSRQLVRSERLASVGFLAAGVAHEINNPLASIAFCSEALERRLAEILNRTQAVASGSDPAVVNRYLKMIQQEAFRCKAITQRLLEFSRGGERKREPTDLAELIQGVLEMVQHLQSCKGKRIAFEPAGRLVAWINGQEIKSVVLNLVVNALDSMDEGGTLTIMLGQRDGMASLVFADTGCGMSPEILENIFEPFFTRSRTGKGTGLGLAISHRVINQHGGEIEAASPGLNKGSTFTVRLPLRPPAEPVKEETLGHAAA
jgi:signal transduction histidine kinase